MKSTIIGQIMSASKNIVRIKSIEGYLFDISMNTANLKIQLKQLQNQGIAVVETEVEIVSVLAHIESLQVAIPMFIAKKIKAHVSPQDDFMLITA